MPSLVYEIDRLDFGTVIIRDVRIGGGMTAETVEISFALRGAIAGELERVRIDGLVVRAIFDDGRVIVPGMSDGSDSALPLKLPGMPVFVTSSSFELATPQGLIVATGSVSVVPSEGGSALMEARLDIGGVADSPSGRVLVSGQGTADDFTGRLEAMDVTARIGGLILSQIDGEFHGRLRRTDGQVVLALSPATVLSRGRIGTDDGLTLSLAAPLALADGASHEAIWARDTAGALRLETGPLSLEAGGYEIRAAGLTVHADADGGRAQLTGADISSVSGPLLAHGVDADIGWDAHLNVEGHVQAAHVEYLSEVALVVPVAADIRLHTDEAGRLLANARLTDRSGDLRIDITALHDIETGRGEAVARVARIVLPSESSKLDRMFPVLASLGMRAEGAVDLRADLSWQGTNFQGTADLLVELDHAATGEWSADNLIGVVHFDSLVPLSTSPAQEIKIGRLDVGIPITQGRMEVELRADGRIAGRITGLDLFGGRVDSDAFLFDPGAGDLALLLYAKDLQLDQVLRSAELGSLTSTGELSGEIPLTVIGGEVAIIGGELRAAPGGGIITYTAG
ncbi:MAG: YdbH domain-containing protein, partial [Alphaproteobacteria bacterium]|nr:YdbH domain-containing protein [Alphaproteobacteria bacterium]